MCGRTIFQLTMTLVAIRELGRIAGVVDRRRKPVGAMALRHFAQLP